MATQVDVEWIARHPAVFDAVIAAGGDPFAVVRAYRMARELMMLNGVDDWELKVGTAKVTGGSVTFAYVPGTRVWDGKPGTLTLSGPLMSLWTPEQQRLLILHEIAHILCPDDFHGPVWQAQCRRLGIEPRRLYGEEGEVRAERAMPWAGTCQAGHVFYRVRAPKKRLYCLQCSPVAELRNEISWRKQEGE